MDVDVETPVTPKKPLRRKKKSKSPIEEKQNLSASPVNLELNTDKEEIDPRFASTAS